jgi:hypothetical protein
MLVIQLSQPAVVGLAPAALWIDYHASARGQINWSHLAPRATVQFTITVIGER